MKKARRFRAFSVGGVVWVDDCSGQRRWKEYAELVEEAGSAVAVLEEEQAGQTSLFAAGNQIILLDSENKVASQYQVP